MRWIACVGVLLLLGTRAGFAQEPTPDPQLAEIRQQLQSLAMLAAQVKALEQKIDAQIKQLTAVTQQLSAAEAKLRQVPTPTAKEVANDNKRALQQVCRNSYGAKGVQTVVIDPATNRATSVTCRY